mgnify:CR=1 FL=1
MEDTQIITALAQRVVDNVEQVIIGKRSEIRMAAFAGKDAVAAANGDSEAFAEAGAGGDESLRGAGIGRAALERDEVFGFERIDAGERGAHIVQEAHALSAQDLAGDQRRHAGQSDADQIHDLAGAARRKFHAPD